MAYHPPRWVSAICHAFADTDSGLTMLDVGSMAEGHTGNHSAAAVSGAETQRAFLPPLDSEPLSAVLFGQSSYL